MTNPNTSQVAPERVAFEQLPDDALVLRPDVAQVVGKTHPKTLARWTEKGWFPRAVMAGGQVAYRVGDVRHWLASRPPIETRAAQ